MKRKLVIGSSMAVLSVVLLVSMTGGVMGVPNPNSGPGGDLSVNCHVHSTGIHVDESVTIHAHPKGLESGDYKYKFDSGDGSTAVSSDRKHSFTYKQSGEYTPRVAVRDTSEVGPNSEWNWGTCDMINVQQKENLQPEFTHSPGSPKMDQRVKFDASSSRGNIQTYRWDFPQDTKNGERVSYKFRNPGHHQVKLTVTGTNGGTKSTTDTINVEFKARCNIEGSRVIDAGNRLTIDAGSSEGAHWYRYSKYGDGDYTDWMMSEKHTFSYNTPTHHRFNPKVQITGQDRGNHIDTDSCSQVIIHQNQPDAEVDVRPSSPNVGQQVLINARDSSESGNGKITNYAYDINGDGNFEFHNNKAVLEHTYHSAGRRIVRVRVTDNMGQTDTTSTSVNVQGPAVNAGFEFTPSNPKTGDTVTFKSTSSTPRGVINSWTWKVNGVTQANSKKFTHTFNNPGTERVELTVQNSQGSQDHTTKRIKVKKSQGKSLSSDIRQKPKTVKPGETVKLSVTGNPTTVSWDTNNDGSYNKVGNPIETTFSDSGTHSVKVKKSNGATETVQVTVGSVALMQAIDQNGNHHIDQTEKATAISYWQNDEAVPGTNGLKISDSKIMDIIHDYRTESRINY